VCIILFYPVMLAQPESIPDACWYKS
jgi:hypothetical protein